MYNSEELAIIIPTKDRPEFVKRHLNSILNQECVIGRIIIVSSGLDISDLINSFKNNLNLEHYHSEPGQIKQRNLGISKLDSRTRLVATMDDDVVFHKNSINEMIKFWNAKDEVIGGVGFNVVNQPSNNHNWLRGKLGFSSEKIGKVFKSGFCTTIFNVSGDEKVEWLNGGATIWLQELLIKNHHNEIDIDWAVMEDLIFSYPLGKKHPLYLCFNAKVDIEEKIIDQRPRKFFIERGKSIYMMGLYFIQTNVDLSLSHFLINRFLYIISLFLKALLFKDKERLYIAIGLVKAFYTTRNALFQLDEIDLINDHIQIKG